MSEGENIWYSRIDHSGEKEDKAQDIKNLGASPCRTVN